MCTASVVLNKCMGCCRTSQAPPCWYGHVVGHRWPAPPIGCRLQVTMSIQWSLPRQSPCLAQLLQHGSLQHAIASARPESATCLPLWHEPPTTRIFKAPCDFLQPHPRMPNDAADAWSPQAAHSRCVQLPWYIFHQGGALGSCT